MPSRKEFPSPDRLLRLTRGMAAIEALLAEFDPDDRYFSFEPQWREGASRASMDDGSGNRYSIVFSGPDVFAAGFQHEAENSPFNVSPPAIDRRLVSGLPERLAALLPSLDFAIGNVIAVTVTFWWDGDAWKWALPSPDEGGFEDLFHVLLGPVSSNFCDFAAEYYEVELDEDVVERFLANETLSAEMLSAVNADVDMDDARENLAALGYPV